MFPPIVPTIRLTSDEVGRLLEARLGALGAARRSSGPHSLFGERDGGGWRAYLHVHRRDRDGSVLATVHVAGPDSGRGYVRRVRIIPRPGSEPDRVVRLRQRA